MAQTVIRHDDALAIRQWDKKVILAARKATFFDQLKSVDTTNKKVQKMVESYERKGMAVLTDNNGFMQSKTLGMNEGREAIFPLQVHNEDEAWVTGDNLLEGHEKNLKFADQAVVWDVYKIGVNRGGTRTKYETALDLVRAMHTQVKIDVTEKLDRLRFSALKPTAAQNVLTTSGTAIRERIGEVVDAAQTGKGIEATGHVIKPVYIGGEPYYVLGLSINDARKWVNSADYLESQRLANIRGNRNPVFTGALGTIENVILMKHHMFEDGKSILMGAQAMLELWGGEKLKQVVGYGKYGSEESMSLGVFLYYGVEGAKFSDGLVFGTLQANVIP